MNLQGKVRRLYYRDGLNLSEIERRTGLTRKTIRRWLSRTTGERLAKPRLPPLPICRRRCRNYEDCCSNGKAATGPWPKC